MDTNVAITDATVTAAPEVATAASGAAKITQFGKGNLAAFAESGQIMATGLQKLMKAAEAAARTSFDELTSSFKAMSAARTIPEAMQIQAKLMQSSLQHSLVQAGMFTSASMKLSGQACAPIAARFSLAAKTLGHTD